jgi:tripartite-type tricarboxylate transporter receptor subunit TctC
MTPKSPFAIAALALALASAAGAALLSFPSAAQAQAPFPVKPLRMVVPFGVGGASDFVARIIGPRLADQLGQPIVIENRPGAGGNVGMEAAARSAPDGYTIFLGNVGTLAINPHVYGPALKLDPLKEFAAVGLVAETTTLLAVHPSLPVQSVKELVAFLKARPGQVNYASAGSGSLSHLQMELLRAMTGVQIVHIPYKGGAGQAVTDVVGGHVPLTIQTMTSVITFVNNGKLRPLGVTTAQRIAALPKVPTLREQGLDIVSSSWQGLLVPAGTAADVVQRLHAAIAPAINVPEVRERFASGATDVLLSASPHEFADHIRAESARWGKVVRAAGVMLD